MAVKIEANDIVKGLSERLQELQAQLSHTRSRMLEAFNQGNLPAGKQLEREIKGIRGEINSTNVTLGTFAHNQQNIDKIVSTANAGIRMQGLAFLEANQHIQQLNAGLTLFGQAGGIVSQSIQDITKPFTTLGSTITNKIQNIGSSFNFTALSDAFKKDIAKSKTDLNLFQGDILKWKPNFNNSFKILSEQFKNAFNQIKPDSFTSALSGLRSGLSAIGDGVLSVTKGIAGLGLAFAPLGLFAFGFFNKLKDTFVKQEQQLKVLNIQFTNLSKVGIGNIYNDFAKLGSKIGVTTDEVIKMATTLSKFKIDTGLFEQATSAISAIAVTTGDNIENIASKLSLMLHDPIKNINELNEAGFFASESLVQNLTKIEDPLERQKILLDALQKQYGNNASDLELAFSQSLSNLDDALLDLTHTILGTGDSWREVMIQIVEWSTQAVSYIKRGWQVLYQTFDVFFSAVSDGLKTLANLASKLIKYKFGVDLGEFENIGASKEALERFGQYDTAIKKVGDSFQKLEYKSKEVNQALLGGVKKTGDDINKEAERRQAQIQKMLEDVQTNIDNIGKSEIEIKVKEITDLGASIDVINQYRNKLEELNNLKIFESVQKDIADTRRQIDEIGKSEIEIKVKALIDKGATDESIAQYTNQLQELSFLKDIQQIINDQEEAKNKTLSNQLNKYQNMLLTLETQKDSVSSVLDIENARLSIIEKIEEVNKEIHKKQMEDIQKIAQEQEKLSKQQDDALTSLTQNVTSLNNEWSKTYSTITKLSNILTSASTLFSLTGSNTGQQQIQNGKDTGLLSTIAGGIGQLVGFSKTTANNTTPTPTNALASANNTI